MSNKIKLYFLHGVYYVLVLIMCVFFVPLLPLLGLAEVIQQTILKLESSNPLGFKALNDYD